MITSRGLNMSGGDQERYEAEARHIVKSKILDGDIEFSIREKPRMLSSMMRKKVRSIRNDDFIIPAATQRSLLSSFTK